MSIDSGLTVGRGPVPRQRRYHRKRIETREGSPTATAPHSVGQDRPILTCSRSGDCELQRPVSRRRGDRGGQAPALRFRRKLILKILLIL